MLNVCCVFYSVLIVFDFVPFNLTLSTFVQFITKKLDCTII